MAREGVPEFDPVVSLCGRIGMYELTSVICRLWLFLTTLLKRASSVPSGSTLKKHYILPTDY
jgi:hypothetical protein